MKKLFFSLTVILLFSCTGFSQSPKAGDKNKPEMTFKEVEHDFTNVPYDGNGTFDFAFKNTGKEAVIIQNVTTSCGCTASEWSKEPYKKGATGVIKVKYNTKIVGNFQKTITVYSNAKNSPVTLRIKGSVEPMKAK
ncbi:MAG: DUF1573 domain-containing protein [Bacteroidota bacterium]|nr:DUF1573 domain-containing protein [Bacteroidota bacterium]MDP4226516.1 DUF1573 domain-containing protein [Bacteroidota bacterium]MDP4274444.1 DUF1573 domain-containing protein [Bacteroidota bacterium]